VGRFHLPSDRIVPTFETSNARSLAVLFAWYILPALRLMMRFFLDRNYRIFIELMQSEYGQNRRGIRDELPKKNQTLDIYISLL
jgi:hypothetical protein